MVKIKKIQAHIRIIFCILGIIYLYIVFWLTLLNRDPTYVRYELTPFWEYMNYFKGNENERMIYGKLIRNNILLFVPFGFMLPAIFQCYRSLKATLLFGLLFSVCIELLQLITARGLCEFDDVFNNTLGAVTGYYIYRIINSIINKIGETNE